MDFPRAWGDVVCSRSGVTGDLFEHGTADEFPSIHGDLTSLCASGRRK